MKTKHVICALALRLGRGCARGAPDARRRQHHCDLPGRGRRHARAGSSLRGRAGIEHQQARSYRHRRGVLHLGFPVRDRLFRLTGVLTVFANYAVAPGAYSMRFDFGSACQPDRRFTLIGMGGVTGMPGLSIIDSHTIALDLCGHRLERIRLIHGAKPARAGEVPEPGERADGGLAGARASARGRKPRAARFAQGSRTLTRGGELQPHFLHQEHTCDIPGLHAALCAALFLASARTCCRRRRSRAPERPGRRLGQPGRRHRRRRERHRSPDLHGHQPRPAARGDQNGGVDSKIIKLVGVLDMSEGQPYASNADQAARGAVRLKSNTTLIGDANSGIVNGHIILSNVSQIIIRNLKLVNPCDVAPVWDPNDGSSGNWNSAFDAISVTRLEPCLDRPQQLHRRAADGQFPAGRKRQREAVP